MKIYLKDMRISSALIKINKSNVVPDAKLIILALDSIFKQKEETSEDVDKLISCAE